MKRVYAYVTSPTGFTHVVKELTSKLGYSRMTLCNRRITVTKDWIYGDETLSGVSANCETCKRRVIR